MQWICTACGRAFVASVVAQTSAHLLPSRLELGAPSLKYNPVTSLKWWTFGCRKINETVWLHQHRLFIKE